MRIATFLTRLSPIGAVLLILIMVVMLYPALPPNPPEAHAATPLGLLVTQEELNCWKQRAGVVPPGSLTPSCSVKYKSAGDVSTNSPGDWTTIQNNANNLTTGSGGNDYWAGNTCGGGWHCPAQPNDPIPPRNQFEKTRDAAFVWLVTGTTSYRDKAKTQLLDLLAEPGLNFGDTSRWSVANTYGTGPFFDVAQALQRLFFGYTYVRDQFTSTQQQQLDAWFLKMGTFFEASLQDHIGTTLGFFNDNTRTSLTDFTLSAMGQSQSSTADGNTLYCGIKANIANGYWNNRSADFSLLFGLIGTYYQQVSPSATTAALIQKFKRWTMEYLLYGVWANAVPGEWERTFEQGSYIGYAYSMANLGKTLLAADALARMGDTELYDMQTTSTGISTRPGSAGYSGAWTWGAGKSLKVLAQEQLKYNDRTLNKAALNCSSPTFPNDYQTMGPNKVHDTFVVQSNLYWRDTCTAPTGCLQTRYLHTSPGSFVYPASPDSSGSYPWGGPAGVLPGVLFMFGNLEGVVNPYGASSSPSPTPTPTPSPLTSVRVNAGGSSYTAADGTYQQDAYFSGGNPYPNTKPIANTADDTLYNTERYGNPFSYDIPMVNGTYDVTLKFAETFWTAPGKRIFDVILEGVERISNLDLYQTAGADTAYDVTLPVTVSDGTLSITFKADVENATINAIKVVPATSPTPTSCSQYTPSTSIPTGFASPYDVVSSPSTNLMNVTCLNLTDARLDLGKGDPLQYIYNQGYLFKTGGTNWTPLSYTSTESLIAGAWYPKTATATISLTSTELANPSYSLAYICSWVGSAWKCGCRDSACTQSYWMIQSFQR